MLVDDVLLSKLQKLAMIEISAQGLPKVKQNLNEILSFVENLNGIDTQDIALDSNLKTPMREDKIIDSDIARDILDSAPNTKDGFFIVPKIIE